jgi:hypothetical protein
LRGRGIATTMPGVKRSLFVLLLAGCVGPVMQGGLGSDGGRDPSCPDMWSAAQAICVSSPICSAFGQQCLYPGADTTSDGGTTAEFDCLDAGYWHCDPSP